MCEDADSDDDYILDAIDQKLIVAIGFKADATTEEANIVEARRASAIAVPYEIGHGSADLECLGRSVEELGQARLGGVRDVPTTVPF